MHGMQREHTCMQAVRHVAHLRTRACVTQALEWEVRLRLVLESYLQAALRFYTASHRAGAPGSQHTRSNASQMPLVCAGGDRLVFLHAFNMSRCLTL